MAKKTKVERSNAAHKRAISILKAKVNYHESVISNQSKAGKVMSKDSKKVTYDRKMAAAGARRAK